MTNVFVLQVLGVDAENMRVVLEKYYYNNELRLLSVPNKTLKNEGFLRSNKVRFAKRHPAPQWFVLNFGICLCCLGLSLNTGIGTEGSIPVSVWSLLMRTCLLWCNSV